MPKPPKPKRRWYQYSLRSLFILTTLVAIACSWYAYEMNEAAKRRVAIKEIQRLDGYVEYDGPYPPWPSIDIDPLLHNNGIESPRSYSLLRQIHGDEYLGNAVTVKLGIPFFGRLGQQVTDAELACLAGLPKLKVLALHSYKVTDTGLVHLKSLVYLESLYLWDTQITHAGLENLKSLPNLTSLCLVDTEITDAGLEALKGFTNLKRLELRETQTSEEDIETLQQALPNCEIVHGPLPCM